MVAEPAAFAVTTPEEDTVATEVLSDDHVTDLLEAYDGVMDAVRLFVVPTSIDEPVEELMEIPVTACFTVTAHVAFALVLSTEVHVMVAVPGYLQVTVPELLTVATEELRVDHVTDLFVAFEGLTVAERVKVYSLVFLTTDFEVLLRLTLCTLTFGDVTVNLTEALAPDSLFVNVKVEVPSRSAVILNPPLTEENDITSVFEILYSHIEVISRV